MKRNITVNMFGVLYPIDEDAYGMLSSYLNNMRDYFSRQPDGKEIADDIEARVAELMAELRQGGVQAITIEHVESIIGRIGNPEQLDPASAEEGQAPAPPELKRKLFRDPDHKVLGGVLGGLGCYLGINPLWLRIAAILLAWASFGIAIVIYLVCWASIPLAVTPAERLQMKGEPVNMSNLCEEFLNGTREMIKGDGVGSFAGGLFQSLLSVFKVLLYVVGIALLVACGVALLGALISVVCVLAAPWGDLASFLGENFPLVKVYNSNSALLLCTCGISLIVLLAITLYIGVHFMLRMLGRIAPMSNPLRVSCLVLWLVSLVLFCGSWTRVVSNVSTTYYAETSETEEERDARRLERQISYLEHGGWTLVKNENLGGKFTAQGEHYSGNKSSRYLEAGSKSGSMEYEVVRSIKVAPGNYSLRAVARADGEGAEVFAVPGNGERLTAAIPVCGFKGGAVWVDSRLALEADTAKVRPDRARLSAMAKVNNERGYGWSPVMIDNITVGPDSVISYGVTNLSATRSWDGTRLSATSFELIKKD